MDPLLEVLSATGERFSEPFTVADLRRPDEPLVYVNLAFVAMTGYSLDEVLNRNCRFLQGAATDPWVSASIRTCINQRASGYFDVLNHKKDGSVFWNRLVLFPVGYDESSYDYYVGIQHNINDFDDVRERFTAYVDARQVISEIENPFWATFSASRSLHYLRQMGDPDRRAREVRNLEAQVTAGVSRICTAVRKLE
jgi:PAS domain S-box-containing protein